MANRPLLRWRWDQGRLDYFLYENVVRMARVLARLEGIPLNAHEDLLRMPLEQGVELPFAPKHYKVWRNYARVFACAMLATQAGHRLVVTDLCRRLADEKTTYSPDQYLNFVFSRFALPFPAFEDYNPNLAPTYPFVAILKFVFSHPDGVTLEDVFAYVIGNGCTGREELSFYLICCQTRRMCARFSERRRRVSRRCERPWASRNSLP